VEAVLKGETMTLKMTLKLMTVLGVLFLTVKVSAAEPLDLKTENDKLNYWIGVEVARSFKQQGIEVNPDIVIKGLRDELSGAELLMAEDDLRKITGKSQTEPAPDDLKSQQLRSLVNAAMRRFQPEMRQQQIKVAEENKKEGEAFLADNSKKEGVITLPSGLQYKILKAGDGRKPTENDIVEVHYRGTRIDGTEFDNSYLTGKPATFKITEVIPGWREALQLMPVGSKWQLFIPPQLIYKGSEQAGDSRPNATLIFELELLDIK
jgi:FKBP-type peptidyl-prolyl cis-trans isomerase FklB